MELSLDNDFMIQWQWCEFHAINWESAKWQNYLVNTKRRILFRLSEAKREWNF